MEEVFIRQFLEEPEVTIAVEFSSAGSIRADARHKSMDPLSMRPATSSIWSSNSESSTKLWNWQTGEV